MHKCLSSLFVEHNDFFHPKKPNNIHWIDEIKNLKSDERIVSVVNMDTAEPESFLVSITNIEETSHTIITLTEITNISMRKKSLRKKLILMNLQKLPIEHILKKSLIKRF